MGNRSSFVLLVAASLLFVRAGLVAIAASPEERSPRRGVECRSDELILHQIIDLRPHNRAPGGPDGPREALAAFLREEHPYLENSSFQAKSENAQAAEFARSHEGRVVATARAEFVPALIPGEGGPGPAAAPDHPVGDWFVERFAACSGFLNAEEGRS